MYLGGSARVLAWWYTGSAKAKRHEWYHIDHHYKVAYQSFKEEAEYHAYRCMSEAKATCIAQVILSEMRIAYMYRALATAFEFDCFDYGGGPGSNSEPCIKAQVTAGWYKADLQALTQALERCANQ